MDPAAGTHRPTSRSRADSESLRCRARDRLPPRSPGRRPLPGDGVPVDLPTGPADDMSAGFLRRLPRPIEADGILAHRIGRERIARYARAKLRNRLPRRALLRLAVPAPVCFP